MITQGLARELGGRRDHGEQPYLVNWISTDLKSRCRRIWANPAKSPTLLAAKRYGSVDDIAALDVVDAGPEASYITGAEPDCRRRHQCLTAERRSGEVSLAAVPTPAARHVVS